MSSIAISGLILLFLIFSARTLLMGTKIAVGVLPHIRQKSIQSQRQKTKNKLPLMYQRSSIEISLRATPRAFEFVYFTVAGHAYVSTPEEIKKCPYYSSSSTILLKQVCQTGFKEQRESAISQGSALKVVEEKLYKYGKLMASNTIKPY